MYSSIVLLLTLSLCFLLINHKFLKLQMSIGLLILGMLLAATVYFFRTNAPAIDALFPHLVENIDFNSFLMRIVLPFLLFAGAIHIDVSELKKQKVSVFVFAIVSTLISTLFIGYTGHWIFRMLGFDYPLLYFMLFGALISPTDPIAVLAIFKSYNVKSSLTIKVEGESLFNDGIGIVIFITLSSMIDSGGESISIVDTALLFLRETVGGISLGLLTGWGTIFILKRTHISKHAIFTTLLIATFIYSIANIYEVSGALAMVAAGILTGNWLHTKADKEIRRDTDMIWETIDELLNAMLFVLMGISLIHLDFKAFSFPAVVVSIVIVLLARFVSVSLPYSLIGINYIRTRFMPGLKEIIVLTWSGLRGGLAFALSLSLINETGGHFFILATYTIATFSIIVQGLTIGKLVTKLKIG
jgi:CPA1 family monovalent cation:H+ antiporter